MQTNHTPHERDSAAISQRSRAARREIGLAIWRARWHAQHDGHATMRVVPTGPERMTWYECSTCGRAGTTTWNEQRHCARCGALARKHEWVRPDIADAERRARRRWYWHRRRQAWQERATAQREHTDRSEARSAARNAAYVSTYRALPK